MSDKHNITNIGSKQRTNDSEQVRSESEGYSNVPSAEESSEESDANSVKSQASDSASECPICLRSFSSQAVGYPEDCASKLHIFCALCIEEWSKNVTTCPIDRKEFSVLCILDNIKNRNCIRKVRVEKREYREELEENGVEDLTYCEVCRLANREHMMLLCDDCDKGYHMDCLTPVLREVPAGSWFCPRCDPERVSDEASEIENVEEVVPRIIRTRQNERIRRAILMRTVAASIINEPGPSRLSNVIQSTLERVTRRMNSDKKRRRRRRKYKTVVKEYEVNSENEKFPSKRSRKVMRSKKSRKKKPRKKKESCFEGFEQGNSSFDSLRVRAGIPTLRLFEPANNLDYFSDENEELETGEVGEEIGYGLTVIRNVRPIGISRGLMKRKVAVRAPDPINILDIIMNNQEKWHSKRVSEEVILRNGKPVFKPIPKHTEAPLNGTEGNNERLAANSSVPPNETRSGTNNSSATNEGSNTSSTANGASTIDAGNNDESGNILGLARFGYIPEEPNKPSQENAFDSDMFREDEEDSCPNFSVYSSEAMTMAQQQEKSQEIQGPMIETDVDLVQLSGEEESSETGKKGDFEHIANKWKPVVAEAQKDESERYKLLALYDSDGGLEDGVAQEELERSYTPCLDERLCDVVGEGLQQVVGIDGMETELISEEEDNNLNETQPESLFKCNVSKKRNYRENRSKSPKIKNQSDDKENKESRKKQDKKELPRYDVRNVIAKASRRDPFGRNKDRNRSRSRSRHSFSESRKSFTISRSPSYDRSKRRNSRSRSKSPYSRRRSKSPKRRSRTPRRRSPLARRRRSNTRSRSRNSVHRSTDIISHKRRSGTTSPVANKGETNKRKKEREKSGKRKRVKEKIKKKRTRSSSKNIEQSWTPPLGALPKPAENLRVVVSNKNRSESPIQSKKKKEKKRRADKKKEKHRKEHRKFRNETMTHETSRPKTASSKEVFASGDNILVSVSFNNISHQERQEAPLVQAQKTAAPEKRTQVKISSKTHPTKSKDTRAHIRKCETKPVAIIDLDNSPFNEVPPSPVIVLSDSDREDNSVSHDDFPKTSVPSKEAISSEVIRPPASPSESPILDEPTFRAPAGPKTPPEPPQTVKFSMIPLKSTRIRQINTIFEQERENDEETAETGSKMGPNTPPEPTPSSPDAYDPFEPTKSPSEHSCEANDTNDGPGSRSSTPTLEETEANLCKSSETMGITEKLNTTMNPVELVMSLINKNSGAAPALSQHINDDHQAMQTEIDGDLTSDLIVEKQIHVLSNVVVTPIKTGIFGRPATSSLSVSTPLKTPAKSPASTSKSVTKIRNAGGSIISKLPLPPRKQGSAGAEGIEIDSPYSPGSSDFDDLFEPPSSTTDTYSKLHKQTVTSSTNNRPMTVAGKIEMFDNLFGSASPLHKFTTVSSTYKPKNTKNKKKQKSKKLDDDEIPSSAVDLQNKDKLLRKLNRQERVIDEVKLVIKPHYNKKRITKEEYKEIMRKAVPKVCHSKSGEINPVKIQALVEAYVKKVRYRRKMQMKGQNS